MAFDSASGYNNLPSGNFTPEIFSQKVLKFFRRASVVEDITNTDYAGEIENFGDTVRIIKEPTITVSSYDANVLQAMVDGAGNTGTDFGTVGAPINIYTAATKGDSAVNMMLAMARALDDESIPEENRFFVAPPAFYEALFGAGAKFAEVQVTGDATSPLRNGLVMQGNIAGMACYKSTALNNSGTDVVTITSQDTTNDFVVLAGHMSVQLTHSATSFVVFTYSAVRSCVQKPSYRVLLQLPHKGD
jgi:hypothetical protein